MTTARKHIINENEIGTYHITARCVRQCWLLDNPEEPDRDFSNRKKWFYDYMELFSSVFCIDIGGYAIMSNHYHVILRNRPDLLGKLTNEELAQRWLILHPTAAAKREKRKKPVKLEIDHFLKTKGSITKCKENLSCISTFMKELNQRVSRRANKEDEKKGRFWEARFNSQVLADEAAVLACMIYVDLNPIRAQVTNNLDDAKYTSAYDRSNTETAKKNIKNFNEQKKSSPKKPTYKQVQNLKEQYSIANSSKWMAKIQRNETEKTKPFIRMSQKDYFMLLDYTGREIHDKKPGVIPNRIPTLLDSMNINHEEWVNQITHYGKWYFRIVGHALSIKKKLEDTKQKWFHGIKKNNMLYKQQPEEA